MNTKHKWLYYRFTTMSLPEIFFRIRQQLTYKYNRKNKGLAEQPSKITYNNSIPRFYTNFSNGLPSYFYTVFHHPVDYTNISSWHYDMLSGKSFPKTYCFDIDIKDEQFGSAKVVWEYNRLQFLTYISVQYRTTNKEKFLQQFQNIITSWIDDNPYLIGVNWYSNIEVNLRLITWFLCWQILDVSSIRETNKDFKKFVDNKWVPSVYQHCKYAYNFPSKFSSANNHLISEYAGLFIATSLWHFKESKKWNAFAKQGLEKEIVQQHSKNGINKEEAAEYIQFITDFFLLAYIAGENTGNAFSETYKERLYYIFEYILNLTDCKGNFPQYGDEDDGKCYILDFDTQFNNFKSLLTSGAIIFNDAKLKSKSNGFDLKNRVLFGEIGKAVFDAIPDIPFKASSQLYSKEGHFILRKLNESKEIYVHLDAAPLGFLSIAAHGHADALSFILHIDGQPVFIDSGTYTYHTEPQWRKYFMGTLAHNTIRINKTDQAFIGGPTMWLKHYKTKILKSESSETFDEIIALHTGYKDLGVTHIRCFQFDKLENLIKIKDTVENKGNKNIVIEQPFHIHPNLDLIKIKNNEFNINTSTNTLVKLMIDDKLNPVIVSGTTMPEIVGWYSPSFLQKVPSTAILSSLETTQSVTFETIINFV